ncbi:MAG: hypothetical protein ACRD1F_06475, partial [Terriglobales bacterium]
MPRTIQLAAAGSRRGPAFAEPITLLTGGSERQYSLGMALALAAAGVEIEVIGGDALESPELRSAPGVRFLNLRGEQSAHVGRLTKIRRVLRYYARLLRYAATARPGVFHILWN